MTQDYQTVNRAVQAPPEFPHSFPLRENCDPTDPFQFALWALVALPGQNGAHLIMPVGYLQLVSKRLWDLGFRHVEEPTLKYKRPSNLDPHWMTSPGSWVGVDEPDDDLRSPARRAADSLMAAQKAELLRELSQDLTPRQRHDLVQKMMGSDDATR